MRTGDNTGSFPHFFLEMLVMACLITGACASTPAVATTPATPSTTTFNQQLQSSLAAKMKEMRVPGAVVFVQSARTGSWTTSIGTSDLKTQAPINPSLYFRVGSITKTFVGTVILQLIDAGKLRLDDPVNKYQPEVPNGAHITIRELLNMRSGLYNYSEDADFDQTLLTHPDKVWTPQELLALSFKHPAYFAPDKDIHYTNTNFILLGLIIEQLTGHPVETELQQRIFIPLGMSQSSLPPRPSAAIPAPYSQGYMLQQSLAPGTENKKTENKSPTQDLLNVTTWNPSWGWTAGSAISTLHDLTIWSKALATGKLVSPAMQKERLTWYSSLTPALRYGLAIADFGGFVGHNGQLPGYQSFEGYMQSKDETIVILTNLYAAPDGSEPADVLARIISKALSS